MAFIIECPDSDDAVPISLSDYVGLNSDESYYNFLQVLVIHYPQVPASLREEYRHNDMGSPQGNNVTVLREKRQLMGCLSSLLAQGRTKVFVFSDGDLRSEISENLGFRLHMSPICNVSSETGLKDDNPYKDLL